MFIYAIKNIDGTVETYRTKKLHLIKKWYDDDSFDDKIERRLYLVYSSDWR